MTDFFRSEMGDVSYDAQAETKKSTIRNGGNPETKTDKEKEKISEELDDEDDDDEGDEGDGEADENLAGNSDKKKKKKKKGKKKKKTAVIGSKLPLSRCLQGFTDSYLKYGQSDPPTKYVADLFPLGKCDDH